jgi:hypothetical protein
VIDLGYSSLRKDMSDQIKKPDYFSEIGDHIVALGSGGAALGGVFGAIPGAIIGGIAAIIYAAISKKKELDKRLVLYQDQEEEKQKKLNEMAGKLGITLEQFLEEYPLEIKS